MTHDLARIQPQHEAIHERCCEWVGATDTDVLFYLKDENMSDLARIPERHESINQRLEEWASWVRVNHQAWASQPIFRMYQSKARQWEIDPVIQNTINALAAHEIEKAVSRLPDKHRTAIRWAYVFSWIKIHVVRRELGVTSEAIAQLIDDSRDMVINKLKSGH